MTGYKYFNASSAEFDYPASVDSRGETEYKKTRPYESFVSLMKYNDRNLQFEGTVEVPEEIVFEKAVPSKKKKTETKKDKDTKETEEAQVNGQNNNQ